MLLGAHHDAEKDKKGDGEEDDRYFEEEEEVWVGAVVERGAIRGHGGPEHHAPYRHGQVDDPWNHLEPRLLLRFPEGFVSFPSSCVDPMLSKVRLRAWWSWREGVG